MYVRSHIALRSGDPAVGLGALPRRPLRPPVVYTRRPRGVGAYPCETCYDPTRSVFVPYWLDTDVEAACVKAAGLPGQPWNRNCPAPPVPTTMVAHAPQTVEQMTVPGEFTPVMSQNTPADLAAYAAQIAAQFPNVAPPVDCTPWYSFLLSGCTSGFSFGTLAALLGVGLVGLVVVGGRR